MKRFLSLTLSAFMIISAVFCTNISVFADDSVQCGDNIIANYSASQHTLTLSGSGAMKDYTVSPWAGIAKYDITDVIIGEGITTIGNSAFAGMLKLENVSIPSTVVSIGNYAFSSCKMLKSIYLPAAVKEIGTGAFRTTGINFKGITVDGNNQYFADINGALYDKSIETLYVIPSAGDTTVLEIPNTVKTIVDRAGYNCVNLKEVVIPESVTVMGNEVFSGDRTAVQKITFKNANLSLPEQMTLVDDTSDLTIAGFNNSTAQAYAKALNIKFEALDAAVTECTHSKTTLANVKKATADAAGYTGDTVCSLCAAVLKKGTTIPKASQITLSRTSINYVGTVQRPTVTVKDSSGKSLTYLKDFNVTYSNFNSTNAGTYTVTVNFIGSNYTGSKTFTYKIVPVTNVTPKLNRNIITTNGTVQRPLVTVTDSKGKALVYNKDFTVSYSNFNSTNVGRYTVTVKMIGNYSGTKTYPYYINPKPTTFKSSAQGGFKAVKNGFTLTWNKQTSQTTGYQLQYATKRDFSNAATVWITNPNTTSKTITGRAGNTRYYVRIRPYTKIGTGTFYGDWDYTGNYVKSVVTLR